MQHLLNRASWDEGAPREQLAGVVEDYLADPNAVLIGDETGDLKKGTRTVGVQRQCSGTADRTENCQVAVYLDYATSRGPAMIDREVSLPVSWTEDRGRCQQAGVPQEVGFATEPTLLGDMVERFLAGGLPASWVTADEACGGNPTLARRLEDLSDQRIQDGKQGLGYVLAISTSRKVPITATTSRPASRVAADLPERSWQTRSAGAGRTVSASTSGPRSTCTHASSRSRTPPPRTGGKDGKPTHSRSWAAMLERTQTRARERGHRWSLLVRRWTSWRRWTLLVMAAHAVLAVATLIART